MNALAEAVSRLAFAGEAFELGHIRLAAAVPAGLGCLTPETPAAVIISATTRQTKVLVATLAAVAARAEKAGFPSPSLIVVGSIVAMRKALSGSIVR